MRYTRDGKVAVVLSPSSGWYTLHGDWNRVFDPDLVQQILDGIGPPGLVVEWVNAGDLINVIQYHGQEKVQVLVRGTHWITGRDLDDDREWMRA